MGRFKPPPTEAELSQDALARIEAALASLNAAMAALDIKPQVQVEPTPITVDAPNVVVPTEPFVQAIASVQDEITRAFEAVANIQPAPINVAAPEVQVDLAPLHDQQESLRLAFEALGEKVVNAATSRRSHYDGRVLDKRGNRVNPASEETLERVATALGAPSSSDLDTRLDYDGRTDSNPVYVGKATLGTTTATGDWSITKLEYDGDNRLIRSRVKASVAWDDRATIF